jgi:predicted nucleotidyltransferase
MDPRQDKILNIVSKYKEMITNEFEIEKVLLFGSFATGTFHKDSDIDVAVFVKNMNEEEFFNISAKLWGFARKIDKRIEPKLYYDFEFKDHENSSILGSIIRQSVEVN